MTLTFMEQFNAARRVSTPTVVIRTADIEATMKSIAYNQFNKNAAMLMWDASRGLTAVNNLGTEVVSRILNYLDCTPFDLTDPAVMLYRAPQGPDDVGPNKKKFAKDLIPDSAILFMPNLHRFMHEAAVIQGIGNLRSPFKANGRMLVIPCPGATLPPELAQDVLVIDEPLPDNEQLGGIVDITFKAANTALENAKRSPIPLPTPAFREKAIDALCGLPAYPAEQQCSMSISSAGLNLELLWERKRQHVEQTPGLSIWRGKERFDDIGGCENAKAFLRGIINGKNAPRACIFQDEIEKAFAGAGGDLSGITQELLGTQLSYMQDHEATGVIFLGVAGAAKSALAKAFGNEAGIPTVQFDLSAMKGSLVGESNANHRNALKVVEAISQGRALWIATCNNIEGLPPELRRRYMYGTFFFDLPSVTERKLIWDIYEKKFDLKGKDRPPDSGWTGAEIKNACLIADNFGTSPKEAGKFIVPLSISAEDRIKRLRGDANGKFISASAAGPYKAPEGLETPDSPDMVIVGFVKGGGRKMQMEEPEPEQQPKPKKKFGPN